jgi:hypothetical protein
MAFDKIHHLVRPMVGEHGALSVMAVKRKLLTEPLNDLFHQNKECLAQ